MCLWLRTHQHVTSHLLTHTHPHGHLATPPPARASFHTHTPPSPHRTISHTTKIHCTTHKTLHMSTCCWTCGSDSTHLHQAERVGDHHDGWQAPIPLDVMCPPLCAQALLATATARVRLLQSLCSPVLCWMNRYGEETGRLLAVTSWHTRPAVLAAAVSRV